MYASRTIPFNPSLPSDVLTPAQKRKDANRLPDYVLAGVLCAVAVFIALFFSTDVLHWCIVPIVLCGIVIGSDGVGWLRGRFDTFDPKGLIGIYGLHFFFLAPLLHVALRTELVYVRNPGDWRHWLGMMAVANFLGLLAYKAVERWASRGTKQLRTVWVAQPGQTGAVLFAGTVIAASAYGYLWMRLGGFSGMAAAFTASNSAVMYKTGIPRILAYALPMMCFFVATVAIGTRLSGVGRGPISLAVLAGLGLLQLVISGLSTSRGEGLTGLVWMLMCVHYLWRPISRVTLAWMLVPALLFLWVYAFYKELGTKVVEYAQRGASVDELARRTNRPFTGLLLGDLARADVQAYLLFGQSEPGAYDLRYGSTYITAFVPMIPYWIWPSKPTNCGKVTAGTDLMWGRGYYNPRARRVSTHAYGLAGEAILNFGVWSVPVSYACFGFLVGRMRRYLGAIQPGDLRFLVATYGTFFLLNMLLWDMDNYIAHTIIRAGFAIPVLWLAVARRPAPALR